MTRTHSTPILLALPDRIARLIDGDAPEDYRADWVRGAVAGYQRRANAISDTPKQLAFKAGHAYGLRLRRTHDRDEQQRDAKLRGAA
jgi:hypothetical protein